MAKRMHATHVETLQEHLEELKNALEGGNNLDNIVYSVTETTRRFIKRLWLSAIPRVLCLHLNRLVGHDVKLQHHVMFQMELEVSEFCLFGQRKKETATYSLRSVVVHHGTSRCVCVLSLIILKPFSFLMFLRVIILIRVPFKGVGIILFSDV